MRLSPFRAIVLALALVVQTFAGGYGVAVMSAGAGARAAPCHPGSTHDQSVPNGGGHHKHDCLSCQACANAAPVVAQVVSAEFRAVRHGEGRIGLALVAVAAPSSLTARAHRARAPPAFI